MKMTLRNTQYIGAEGAKEIFFQVTWKGRMGVGGDLDPGGGAGASSLHFFFGLMRPCPHGAHRDGIPHAEQAETPEMSWGTGTHVPSSPGMHLRGREAEGAGGGGGQRLQGGSWQLEKWLGDKVWQSRNGRWVVDGGAGGYPPPFKMHACPSPNAQSPQNPVPPDSLGAMDFWGEVMATPPSPGDCARGGGGGGDCPLGAVG